MKADDVHTTVQYSPAIGLGYEPGVTRRDPSCVIKSGARYHVWYTKTSRATHGYDATIWYATSPDGRTWTERGEALPRGGPGAWDEQSVFTPGVLVAEGRTYLFYTSVEKPYSEQALTAIGVAVADSPDGPWIKHASNPILETGPLGAWDSHRVDDACLIVRDGRYWLYYKGRQMGLSPRETKMGLAIADHPLGPYVKHPANPLIASGHEVLVWPMGEGVAAWVQPVGPAGGTIQYSPDGVHFQTRAEVVPPRVPGPYCPDAFTDTAFGHGFTWGICQNSSRREPFPFLERFDCRIGQMRTFSDLKMAEWIAEDQIDQETRAIGEKLLGDFQESVDGFRAIDA